MANFIQFFEQDLAITPPIYYTDEYIANRLLVSFNEIRNGLIDVSGR
jgi:hypothetical protein